MNQNWKEDPRLKNMSPEKLDFLENFTKTMHQAKKSDMLSLLLTASRQSTALGFTDEETGLLISILTEHASPKERQQFQLLYQLSSTLQKQSSSNT